MLKTDVDNPPNATLEVTMTTTDGLDPALGIFDDDGTCTLLTFNDDDGLGVTTRSHASIAMTQLGERTFVTATSYLPDAAGDYALTVRPTLCGVETMSASVFDQCARAMSMGDDRFSCSTSNPCARDEFGELTGEACCISVANGGDACERGVSGPIRLFASTLCEDIPR
jgi:hypothetical protein